jgi:hypothetical protein
MAAKLYTEDIDKTINWGGDEKTNGLPVSGEKVQKFIKETLAKKFGYMKYDRDSNQYWVFADEDDYNAYIEDPDTNASLRLTTFDAPAPATINISNPSKQVNTILLSEIKDQKLSFNYLVRDSSNAIKPSRMSIVISINNNISGVKTVPTQTLDMVLDATNAGIPYEFKELGEYLSEGTNTITVTLTSLQYNVSTSITYQYKVLNLMLTSTFADEGSDFYYYNGISLTENEFFGTTLTAAGTGAKYLRVFIDGENIYGEDDASQYIGSNSPQNFDLNLQFKNANGEYKDWATAGKHSLQFYFFVLNEASEEIKSQTLYYDIVFTEPGMQRGSYVLFTRTLDQGALVDEGDVLEIASEQYESISLDYAIYDTSGRGNSEDGSAVIVELKLTNKKEEGDEEVMTTQSAVPSSSTSRFNYTFNTYGTMELSIKNTVSGGETIKVNVEVAKSSVQIEPATTNLVLELNALNRSNSEPAAQRNVWEYVYTPVGTTITQRYQAVFNNVLWNSQNGWIDDCLVLNNGATVTIPVNIFNQWNSGLTFEIDFETTNVQDDDANIMKYGSEGGAHIFINACNAELQSNNKVNIHTNYKENSRQKIQFIFNGNSFNSNDDALKVESPYLMYIVTNGILDRAAQFTGTDSLGANSADSFTIGNLDGKATIKIHAIRIYRRAITLDECVDNYIADSSDIRKRYLFNDVYNEGSSKIDVNKILNANIHIPVMTIYGDVTNSIVQVFNKKSNVPVDILYQDPENPEFNYFARDAWLSNQGTSSMNYPRRNFRLYFNKTSDNKTLRGFASNDHYNYETRVWYGLTDETVISQIQENKLSEIGISSLDDPITINGVTYTCFTNKKTLNKKPANIKGKNDLAIWFVHSGIKLYSDPSCEKAVQIKKLNKYLAENPDGDIWVQGAYAHYKSKDLYTDRWTLKCDYAESSMTHNAGVGRLWGDVMRDVEVGSEGFTYDIEGNKFSTPKPGATNAQRAAQAYDAAHAETDGRIFGDIRTSCDGRPIVIVNRPRIKDENGQYKERYGDPVFLGLYNIMTDKGSTPLFGFEDLKDEDGNTIYNAGNDVGVQRTECWECLQNGSELAQMSNLKTDDKDGSTVSDNENRLIWKTYEARWPDNKNLNDTLTNKLETVIRFVNFCQPAVSVKVGAGDNVKDGYTLSDFTEITEEQAEYYSEHLDEVANNTLYIGVPATSYKDITTKFYKPGPDGATQYDENEKPILYDPEDEDEFALILKAIKKVGIVYFQDYASQNVTGSSFTALFSSDATDQQKVNAVMGQLNSNRPYVFSAEEDESSIEQVEYVYAPNTGYRWFIFDNTYDRSVVTKTVVKDTLKDDIYIGKVYTFDGKRRDAEGEQLWPNAWVNVYLTKSGNNYTYTDEMGNSNTRYASGEDIITETCSGNVGTRGASFKGKTLFEYFQDKKYEHFDVWKLAAYYVYMMRFAAVDQVIKNTMMTTEDGKHYYFINYDNDTVMGVRNDGYLAYDWQVTRETYDYSVGSYAYAGFGSSLWNLLEQDDDFMKKVQTMATSMVTSNVLTYDIALDMFNNKQAGTWSERLYNNSELYKYIGTYNDLDNRGTAAYNPYQNTKYLPFLQGSRASHRDWWLRHRFDLYDSKWGAGEYATNALEFYMGLTASPSNKKNFLRIVPGSRFYFTIQSNNRTLGNNFVELAPEKETDPELIAKYGEDKSYFFETSETLILGNPMKMLGPYKVKVLDFSEYRDSVGSSMNFNWSADKGSMIKELIIGGPKTLAEQNGCAIQQISNLNRLTSLEVLDIRTCYNLSSTPDISTLGNLHKFLASDSNITNFLPAKGLNLEEVSLPSTIQNIVLDNVTIAQPTEEEIEDGITTKFNYSPNTALTHVEILDCEGIDIIDFLNTWYKDLKRYNVLMTQYSVVLSFGTIELPEKIDGVDSLTWLNNIRKDFGKNTNGEDNFKIKKGIIKLYGHGVDEISGEPTGGLTQEDYYEILKYWPEEYFRSDNAVHFDANQSIFITVKSDSSRFEADEYEDNTYNLVSGQTATVNVTIFPTNNERVIKLIPQTLNTQTGRYVSTGWSEVNGRYSNNFGVFGANTYLTNDNGISVLTTGEYSDGVRKKIRLSVQDSLDPQSANKNFVYIELLDTILPQSLVIYDTDKENPITNQTQEITDINKEYLYRIEFNNEDEVNVDVKSITATFGNTNISESENGKLTAYIDEEDGKMYVKYLPKINKGETENTLVNVYVNITMNDTQKTVITRNRIIPIIIKTNNIEGIILESDGNEIDKVDGTYIIKNYIRSLNGEKQITYHYDVKINPSDYNVIIKSMDLDTSGSTSTYCQIQNIEKANRNDPNAITGFDIVCDLRRTRTMEEGGELVLNLVATDSNNNIIAEITQPIDWTVGCYYPDEIKLVKKENNSPWVADYLNVDLLNGETKSVRYEAHIYSLINGELYYWSNDATPADDVVSQSDTRPHFLDNTQYPIYTSSNLTVVEDPDEGEITKVIENSDININGNKFNFATNNADEVITVNFNVKYRVSFNGVNCDLDTTFSISKSPAIESQGNWQNLPAGENGTFYYMDKELRFYTADKLGRIENINALGAEKVIAAVVYRYDDAESNKRIVSVDPWQLKDQKLCYWWKENSSMDADNQNGQGIFANGSTDANPDYYYNLFFECSGKNRNSSYENISLNDRFECMYNYYAFICARAGETNLLDGGNFEVFNTSTGRTITNLSNVAEVAHKLESKEYSIRKNITDNNMIFSVYDYYRTNYQMGVNGRILSASEIAILYNHRDEFAAAIQKIDIGTTLEAWKKLLIDDEKAFVIGNPTECAQYNATHQDNPAVSQPQTQWNDASNTKYSKWFSCNDVLEYYGTKRSMPAIDVYYDRSYNNGTGTLLPGTIKTEVFTGRDTITSHFKLYYIATPCI